MIQCKMCGGSVILTPDRTIGVCEYCGSTNTYGKISDEQRAAAFNRGNDFRRASEFDNALAAYEQILREDDTDAEAHWCAALCRFGIDYVRDPDTLEWFPTCHRASFNSFLEDVDYLAALEHSDGVTRLQYRKDAAKIAEVQKGILATSQNEEPYDVFICFKDKGQDGQRTPDSILAQDIYYQLTERGHRVFFSRITLEGKGGAEYEPYIFAALNSAKVMVAVGTSPEHFNSVWVKNEWSRFLALMRKDRNKMLLPCYRDMDPYHLPEQLKILQSYDMAKIGFLQDLIHGVDKVVRAEQKSASPAETVVVQQGATSNVNALVKRGYMALEDGDWKKADDFFEQALNQDAELAEAYWGKMLASEKCSNTEKWVEQRLSNTSAAKMKTCTACPRDSAEEERIVNQYAIPGYLPEQTIYTYFEFDRSYLSAQESRASQQEQEHRYLNVNTHIQRATRFAKGDFSVEVTSSVDRIRSTLQKRLETAQQDDAKSKDQICRAYRAHLHNAEEEVKQAYSKATIARETVYQNACDLQAKAQEPISYQKAADTFLRASGYKDAESRRQECINEMNRLLCIERERRAEQARREAEEQKKKRKMHVVCALGVVTGVVLIAILVTTVFIPMYVYKHAEESAAACRYYEAIKLFESLGNYSDSATRANDLTEEVQEIVAATPGFHTPVSAGKNHTAAIYKDGSVVAVGENSSYQCNTMYWNDVVSIDAGAFHTVGLKKDGTAITTNPDTSISSWKDLIQISAGWTHTVGLCSDHTVVVSGETMDLSTVNNWTEIVAVAAGNNFTVGLKLDGTVVANGENHDNQCATSHFRDIVAITAGGSHTVGLKYDGTVVAVGSNSAGQCDVDEWTDIVAISAGREHTVGLKADGTVVATGSNIYGICDVTSWTDVIAIDAGEFHTVALCADGTILAAGDDNRMKCSGTADWSDIMIP